MDVSVGSPGAAAGRPAASWPQACVWAILLVLTLWWVAYEVVCVAAPSAAAALPFAGVAPDIPFAVAGVLLIARGITGELGWTLFGVGSLCWAAGDIYWETGLSNLNSPPVPSWADAGYLLFCPLAFAGIFWLVRRRVRGVPKALIADALAAALAVGGLSAAFALQAVIAHAKGGTMAVATNLAYPIVDLMLLALIVGAIAISGWRLQRMWVLLGASVLAFWIADSLYLVTVANNTYQQNAWFNPLWYASPIIAAWAAWLPDQRRQFTRIGTGDARGIVMPLVFALAALGALVRSSFSSVGVISIVLCTASLLVVMVRLVLTWRENACLLRVTQKEALTDALTELPNRRSLSLELEHVLAEEQQESQVLALFDLDGFKHYNDSFGHAAGDALLIRLGHRLAAALEGCGTAFRMGGDEFCVLIDAERQSAVQRAAAALSEQGEGFEIGCSFGMVTLPQEARDPSTALRIADQRMYANKQSGRASASRQSGDVLVSALAARDPELGAHLEQVADLARATAERFSLEPQEVEHIRQGAQLHDVGKVAIPDEILDKPGPLNDEEWEFIRRHTLIGERILASAPALRSVASLVRSSHENVDGSGYPDGLAREEIPIGSRIIAVCDAFNAMTTDRPYRRAMDDHAALSELRRCAGRQFDVEVVERFCEALMEREALVSLSSGA